MLYRRSGGRHRDTGPQAIRPGHAARASQRLSTGGTTARISTELTQAAMSRLLKPRRGAVQIITLDNGSEFPGHEAVAKAVMAAMYFCDPYCSGQRGTNENTNGLIRQYFPKGTDFRQVSNAELRKVVEKLNDRPRKRLGYWIPAQVFLGEYSGGLDTVGATLTD